MSSRNLKTKFMPSLMALALVFGFTAFFSACSDDPTSPVEKAIGDPNDSEFTAIEDELTDAALEFAAVEWMDALWDSIPAFGSSPIPAGAQDGLSRSSSSGGDTVLTFSFTVDEVSNWMTLTASVTNGVDTAAVVDSIRMRRNGVPIHPDLADSADGADIRAHASVVLNDNDDFVGTAMSHASMSIDLVGDGGEQGDDTLEVSATGVDSLIGTIFGDSATCDIALVTNKTVSNVVEVDGEGEDCPISGSISASATTDLDCQLAQGTLEASDTWTVFILYNGDGTADVVYENATTRWESVLECESSPSGNIGFPGRK